MLRLLCLLGVVLLQSFLCAAQQADAACLSSAEEILSAVANATGELEVCLEAAEGRCVRLAARLLDDNHPFLQFENGYIREASRRILLM